jgi:uncharacterized repeat protein (TIGR01451 family)
MSRLLKGPVSVGWRKVRERIPDRTAQRAVLQRFTRIAFLVMVAGFLSTFAGSNAAQAQAQFADLTLTNMVNNANPHVGDTITYTIRLTNAGPDSATGVEAVDQLPTGLSFVSANPGQGLYNSVTGIWAVGTVAPGDSATLQIDAKVLSLVVGANTASITNSDQFDPDSGNNSATKTISVLSSPPTITQSFNPTSIPLNGTAQLTFTLGDTNPSGLTGVGFTDTLPAGLVVATPNGLTGTCGGSTISAPAGSNSISLSNATLGGGGGCSFSVNVTGTSSGMKTNTTSAVSSTEGGNGGTATATLTVNSASPPTITQAFGAASIPFNGTTSLTFTVTNPNSTQQLNGVGFTDTLPAGLVATATSTPFTGSCGTSGALTIPGGGGSINLLNFTIAAGGTCSITVNVTGTSSGIKTNTTSAISSTEGGVGGTASASLTVNPASSPTITQNFGAASIPLNGTTSLTFTITDPNSATPLTGVGFNDALPAGLVVATPNGLTGSCGGGVIAAGAGSGSISLSGGSLAANGTCSFSVTVTGTTSGAKTNTTSAISSTEGGNGGTASASLTVGTVAPTTITLSSSANPSGVGQAVTFSASVAAGGGATPTGTVTFKDGSAAVGTATLSAGVATFTISSLALGTHTITAAYGGAPSFSPSTSAALTEVVSTPADSLKLRAMQLLATPAIAQTSGQAIAGAVNTAITEGFSGGGAFIAPSGSGIRFNFAADPEDRPEDAVAAHDPFSSVTGSFASGTRGSAGQSASRVDDAFGALAYAAPTKAPPRHAEQKDWLGWAEVRGAILDRSSINALNAPALYGDQVNLIAGLTRRLRPDFIVGVLGGYETFDYRSDELQGRLKGDGWTVGSYLGWMLAAHLRFDAAIAYSGIGYDGTAGTAAATFGGHRLLVSGGLTGSYETHGLQIEPSARVYALWEREDAYTDTLGTAQDARNFSTGRASGGVKLAYPVAWSPTMQIAPYVGVYGDYYFNTDDAGAVAIASAIPAAIVLDGWSARATGGVAATFGNGAQVTLGGERSGLGSGFSLWTYRAGASVPFAAQ